MDQSTGYTDRTADSKEECCNMCGMKAGCQDFVFEPTSGTCVLLPHVVTGKITSSHNEYACHHRPWPRRHAPVPAPPRACPVRIENGGRCMPRVRLLIVAHDAM